VSKEYTEGAFYPLNERLKRSAQRLDFIRPQPYVAPDLTRLSGNTERAYFSWPSSRFDRFLSGSRRRRFPRDDCV